MKKALVYLTQYVEMKQSLFIDISAKLQICTYTWIKINKQEGAFTKVAREKSQQSAEPQKEEAPEGDYSEPQY